MPGITGIVGKSPPNDNSADLHVMVERMMHEPFYKSGTYVQEELGLYLGWTCFDDPEVVLPIWNEQRNICLIFSGEQYSDSHVAAQLSARGHQLEQHEASWIVHLYEEVGPKALEQINGWFSGVLVDLGNKRAFLFNDRYGLNRIYYHEGARGFYFASEAKSLLKVLPGTRQLDLRSLGEWFSCGCVLQDRSLFKGVSLLPPGSMWEFGKGDCVKKGVYFTKASWESQSPLGVNGYYEKLRALFPAILKRYLNGNKPVGVSLTGGVDSRMMMAWAKAPPGSLPCYTFGSRYRDSIDVEVARQVAKVCEQPHEIISVGSKFLTEFPTLAERTTYLTDGAMDVSGAADLFVNRIAREIAPIRLTGNYGGEILRELVAFKPSALDREFFDPEFRQHMEKAKETYAEERRESQLSFIAFKQVPWHHYSRLSLERSQIVLRSPYLDNDLVKLAYQTPPEIAQSNLPSLKLITEGNPNLGRIGTDRGILSRPIPLITKLKHLYQEFTFKAEYAYDYGMPHWLAGIDSALSGLHLERLFLGRHKFHHFRIWYRDELAPYLKEVLLDRRTTNRSYLRGASLEQMVNHHVRGIRNYTLEFHRILTSEHMQRYLIEQ
jgi:asparagine synthase (glutamine-hydrolysing)